MALVSLDLETDLIMPGCVTPPIVCGSEASDGAARLVPSGEVVGRARALLAGDVVAGANVAFDFGCLAVADATLLEAIFAAYAGGRVHDVQVAQALDAVARGTLGRDPATLGPLVDPATGKQSKRYSLATCVYLTLGRADAKKNDAWRMRYALLRETPLESWPAEAREYPLDDARNTLEVAARQLSSCLNLGDHAGQVETAWALHLGAAWGLRTDAAAIDALEAGALADRDAAVGRHRARGFFDAAGGKDRAAVKRAVAAAYGASGACPACGGVGRGPFGKGGNDVQCPECSATGVDLSSSAVPRTATGGLRADRDALAESGDDDLADLADSAHEKVLSTYVPFLRRGVDRPICLRPNAVLATGRVSYDDPIQQFPREPGPRECVVARPGYVLFEDDYSAGELCTLAQVCLWLFGRSAMAEAINESGNPGALHTEMAATLLGVDAADLAARVAAGDEEAKRYRQAAKAAMFGLPGGMGPAKFVVSKRDRGEGTTTAPDGRVYPGLRFCLLIGGAARCGEVKVTEWAGRATPPVCRACVDVVHERVRPAWRRRFPEMVEYLAWAARVVDAGGEVPCLASDGRGGHRVVRVRGGVDFTSAANTPFQALMSDVSKLALRRLTRLSYLDRSSPAWGARFPAFHHDALFCELPEATASEAAAVVDAEMVRAGRDLAPDVAWRVEGALMRRWSKRAKAVRVGGRLVPWEDAR